MKMDLTLVIFILLDVLRFSSSQLCGQRLVRVMQNVCGSRGYYGSTVSSSRRVWGRSVSRGPEITEEEANSFLSTRRSRRGSSRVVEECCKNPCPTDVLESYCNPPEMSTDMTTTVVASPRGRTGRHTPDEPELVCPPVIETPDLTGLTAEEKKLKRIEARQEEKEKRKLCRQMEERESERDRPRGNTDEEQIEIERTSTNSAEVAPTEAVETEEIDATELSPAELKKQQRIEERKRRKALQRQNRLESKKNQRDRNNNKKSAKKDKKRKSKTERDRENPNPKKNKTRKGDQREREIPTQQVEERTDSQNQLEVTEDARGKSKKKSKGKKKKETDSEANQRSNGERSNNDRASALQEDDETETERLPSDDDVNTHSPRGNERQPGATPSSRERPSSNKKGKKSREQRDPRQNSRQTTAAPSHRRRDRDIQESEPWWYTYDGHFTENIPEDEDFVGFVVGGPSLNAARMLDGKTTATIPDSTQVNAKTNRRKKGQKRRKENDARSGESMRRRRRKNVVNELRIRRSRRQVPLSSSVSSPQRDYVLPIRLHFLNLLLNQKKLSSENTIRSVNHRGYQFNLQRRIRLNPVRSIQR